MTVSEMRDIVSQLIHIESALEGGTELMSNQGQALDGFSALASFRALAKRAKVKMVSDEFLTEINLPNIPKPVYNEFGMRVTQTRG